MNTDPGECECEEGYHYCGLSNKPMKKKKIKKDHAKYSPSSSHRWLECAGSIQLSEKCPPSPETPAAKEGTAAHKCLEILLINGIHKQLSTERFLLEQGYPAQMVLDAAWTAREIWKLTPKGAELVPEAKSKIHHIDPEFDGTLDAQILVHFDLLHIIDFKYGKMPVEADENTQMIAYALGIAHLYHYNFARVKCTIIQPRASHDKGPIRSWETPIETLFEWADRFKEGIAATKVKKPKFKAGEHCFFCPGKQKDDDGKHFCKHYTPEATQGVRSSFGRPTKEQSDKRLALDFAEF